MVWTWLSDFYSSVAPETTLSSGISGANTSITVGSVVGFPVNTPYTLALDYEGLSEELVQVNSAAGINLSVTRAVDGTSAASHNAGARVRHVSSARDFMDSRNHENADDGIHGLAPGDVLVGEQATQTLLNKTLNAPIINNAITVDVAGALHLDSTGTLRSENVTDVSLSSTGHAFQVGPSSGANIRMDNNELMAVNNGATSTLSLQADGGTTTFNASLAADNVTNAITANGTIDANIFSVSRASAAGNAFQCKVDAAAQEQFVINADGEMTWGSGAATNDTNLFRSAANTLRTNDSLVVDGTITTADFTQTNNATMNVVDINVLQVGNTLINSASLLSSAAGFSVDASSNAVLKGGMLTINVTVTRTGADIVTPANGDLGNVGICTINLTYRPLAALGSLFGSLSNIAGIGSGRIATDGQIFLQSWVPNQTIATGQTLSCTYTYPID